MNQQRASQRPKNKRSYYQIDEESVKEIGITAVMPRLRGCE